jgi:hypothetical protein
LHRGDSGRSTGLIDIAARAALLLDHVDARVVGWRSLINARTRSLPPVLVQRQALADHLARLLDRLGLDRTPRRVPDLHTYVGDRCGSGEGEGHFSGNADPDSCSSARDKDV